MTLGVAGVPVEGRIIGSVVVLDGKLQNILSRVGYCNISSGYPRNIRFWQEVFCVVVFRLCVCCSFPHKHCS